MTQAPQSSIQTGISQRFRFAFLHPHHLKLLQPQLLLKASRGVALERLLPLLQERLG
jgi:hypothetical protein